jgi:hypothetical protein
MEYVELIMGRIVIDIINELGGVNETQGSPKKIGPQISRGGRGGKKLRPYGCNFRCVFMKIK